MSILVAPAVLALLPTGPTAIATSNLVGKEDLLLENFSIFNSLNLFAAPTEF